MVSADSYRDDALGWAAPRMRRSGLERLASILLITAIVLDFSVSSMALTVLGVKYDSDGGPPWAKLHPATYLCAMALGTHILACRPIGAYARALIYRFPGGAYFLFSWALLAIYGVTVQSAPVTSIVEPYLLAVTALIMFDELQPGFKEFLRRFLHVILTVNSLIGVFEYLTHQRLFPYVISGAIVYGDVRATAILGHPLLNAATTGAYLLCLVMGGDRKLSPPARIFLLLVSMAGMVAFGGRTAISASSLVVSVYGLHEIALILLGRRFSLPSLIGTVVVAQLGVVGIVIAASGGVFNALLNRFADDNGSASSRVIVWRLLDMFDRRDLLLGPRPDLLVQALKQLGLEIGIENTWLALMFQYGLLMTVFFVIGLFCLFWEFWRRTRGGGTLLFVYFIIVISSAIGLAAKTMIFVQFSMILLTLFGRDASRGATTTGRAIHAE